MQQVLLRIPLTPSWLPSWLPLWAVLLAVFLAAAGALYWGALFAPRWKLDPKGVQGAAVWVAVAGLIVAGVVLFFIANNKPADGPPNIPIYGFGMMLFIAFVVCNWLGGRRAAAEGVSKEAVQDLAIWLIIGGLIGARLTSLISSPPPSLDPWSLLVQFVSIWDGGIVLYGAVIGGLVAYVFAYYFIFRKQGLSTLKLADIVAPSLAVGLCLGRIGCFLNGCCYGQVACTDGPVVGVSFPLSAPPRYELVGKGYQTAAGFTVDAEPALDGGAVVDKVTKGSVEDTLHLRPGDVIEAVDGFTIATPEELNNYKDDLKNWPPGKDDLNLLVRTGDQPARLMRISPYKPGGPAGFTVSPQRAAGGAVVDRVEPASAAAASGLVAGDVIRQANARPIYTPADLSDYLGNFGAWPRGQNSLALTVYKAGEPERTLTLWPWTLRLHPTQLYESVSMFLLFLLLTAYYPFRRHDGQVMALMMICYAAHRYINELLRADERPVGFESWTSVILFVAGVALWVWLWRRPAQYRFRAPESAPATAVAADGIRAANSAAVSPAPAPTTATSALHPGPRPGGR
jgi:phosphatidylglycerol---prolipoprotein diacylglyceryl transferase